MADFFTRMAERALGIAPVAAPDIPSMFVPAAPLERSSEIAAPRENLFSRASATPSVMAADRSENAPTDPLSQSAMESARRSHQTRSSNTKTNPRVNNESAQRVYRAEETAKPLLDRSAEISHRPRATVVSAIAHGLESRDVSEPLDRIAPQLSGSPTTSMRGEPAAPSIHVSIGRVEVRAVTAPTQQPRPRERKPAPLRPLDQYLRERNEGRR